MSILISYYAEGDCVFQDVADATIPRESGSFKHESTTEGSNAEVYQFIGYTYNNDKSRGLIISAAKQGDVFTLVFYNINSSNKDKTKFDFNGIIAILGRFTAILSANNSEINKNFLAIDNTTHE